MATARSSEKTSYHHGDLKAVLLDETARILRDEGEEALSLRRLASNVGVSRTAPYHHFKDKQSLLGAVAEEGFIRFNLTMKAVLDNTGGYGGERIMREYVKAYVNFAVNHSEYYELMYGRKLWRSESLTQSLQATARGTLRSEVERMQHLQDLGLISKHLDILRFTQVVWGLLHGISRLLIDGVYTDSASSNSICDTAAAMLWQQLKD
jgi:AcrR family transcriptional regulator